MATSNENAELADRFGDIAERFCALVDSSKNFNRNEFASQTYRILPKLIDQAIGLPDVESSDNDEPKGKNVRQRAEEWDWLYNSLKEKFGEWDIYRQVFDPTRDTEAIHGSLADDITDIYRDLKEGVVLKETGRSAPEDFIWIWRLGFYSHWGKHAIDALLAIHIQLQNAGGF
jgi:hypothetical protein